MSITSIHSFFLVIDYSVMSPFSIQVDVEFGIQHIRENT